MQENGGAGKLGQCSAREHKRAQERAEGFAGVEEEETPLAGTGLPPSWPRYPVFNRPPRWWSPFLFTNKETEAWRMRHLAQGPSRKRLRPGPEPRPASLQRPSFSQHNCLRRSSVFPHPAVSWGPRGLSPVAQSFWLLASSSGLHLLSSPEHFLLGGGRDRSPALPHLSAAICVWGAAAHPLTPQSFLLGPESMGGGTSSLSRHVWRPGHWPQPSGPCPSAGTAVSPSQVREIPPRGLYRLQNHRPHQRRANKAVRVRR